MAGKSDCSNGEGGPALETEGLRKSFGDLVAVDGVSVRIGRGECVGLLGPNGAGKSTTMRMCLGLSPADSGRITLLGLPMPESLLEARRRVGVVPQDDWLDPDFSVGENLLVYASYYRMPAAEAERRIPELLERAGLAGREGDKIKALSGGLRRRLSLARALVNDPELVFLDEPTTGLDPQARHLYWERLRLLKDQGRSLFLTTHFMEEAERLCDRLYVIDHGKVIAEGSPKGLVSEHIEREVAEIHGEEAVAWANAQPGKQRVAVLGRVAYCYANDVSRLASAASKAHTLTVTSRPTNLEDVYLRLTGHSLRE